MTTQTCPRRVGELGPWDHSENLDTWESLPNGDRVCSFCGSMHPDDLIALFPEAIDPNSTTRVELSTKQYKLYIQRDTVSNALMGAIKFYRFHEATIEDPDLHITQLRMAITASQKKFEQFMNQNRQAMLDRHGNRESNHQ